MTRKNSEKMARELRRTALRMLHRAQVAHAGSNLSLAEILAVLYGDVLRVRPRDPSWENRDRFVLSKGHGTAILYAALALRGFFPKSWLDSYYLDGGRLPGHTTHHGIPGVEVSTGSLGHGLPLAAGMALAAKRGKKKCRSFVVVSDGEMDEGSSWEAVFFAGHHALDNLVAIVDYNKIQSLDWKKNTLDIEPFADKWRSFGWEALEVDGHDAEALASALSSVPFRTGKPTCVIAHTVKGKGVSFMEKNPVEWHYWNLTDELLDQALKELQ